MEDPAKKSFLKALNKVQALIEPVKKDSINSHYKNLYASLQAVNEAVMPLLLENGFILSQGGIQGSLPGEHRTFLRTQLTHVDGHSMYFDYPLTTSENPQQVASSVSYARRYSICALLNLSVEDDDGTSASRVPAKEAKAVTNEIPPTGGEAVRFIPKMVETRSVDIKKGAKAGTTGTMFTIVAPNGNKYSTLDETGGQIAEQASELKREITFVAKVNGTYLNAHAIRFVEKTPEEAVPF